MTARLPIDEVLADLTRALLAEGRAVLQAPPGAGKTTRVPLALLEAGIKGRILILEPRRLAARAAAARMAETLGEPLGQTVGYRIRGEAKVSRATRIEVVTEGILTRRLQSDPELAGVGAVIFDEFHERSLNGDLGLALWLEVREAFRPDLCLLVMSATLDAAPVAALMGDAPIVTSEGRAFPVEPRWLARPTDKSLRFENAAAALILEACGAVEGSVLAFLPGEGEIRRVMTKLGGLSGIDCHALYGAMALKDQRAAIAPAKGRKLVLATAIAETSLTIEGITCVVDCGRARRARFDPASGMSRLVTERVTRAEAVQRMGRAGRLAPGVCYKLWTKGEEGGMQAFPPPEIDVADLSALALELALWGASASDMAFLSPPPEAGLAQASSLLQSLSALDGCGAITPHGKAMAALPLHPRLAHMLLVAGAESAPIAALLSDRDPLRGAGADLTLRLGALKRPPPEARAAVERIRLEAKRLAALAGTGAPLPVAAQVALAYPDRIAMPRAGQPGRYLMASGKEAAFWSRPQSTKDPLEGTPILVLTDLDGDRRRATIRQAIALPETQFRAVMGDQITTRQRCSWNARKGEVEAVSEEVFGALVLKQSRWLDAPPEARRVAVIEGVREVGLTFAKPAQRLATRIEMLRAGGADMPDVSPDGLPAVIDTWIDRFAERIRRAADIRAMDLHSVIEAQLTWEQSQTLARLAPPDFTTPLGRRVAIDYDLAVPEISVRLQEMFGVSEHPTIGQDRRPLRITLLSPAGRPLQVTQDLPGFWKTSYADVRKDMRGRYPKHPWPEDPTEATPTTRRKPRP